MTRHDDYPRWLYGVTPRGIPTARDTAEGVSYRAELDEQGQIVGITVSVPMDRLSAQLNIAEAAQGMQGFRQWHEPATGAMPSAAAVADMLADGMGRAEIAERYGRSVRTADDWIAKARREFPDRVPPARTGRPASTARLLKAGASRSAQPMHIETPEPNQSSGNAGESPTNRKAER